jgi:hypothetical protein
MKKLKATEREKQMDSAIAEMRRPYNYKITAEKLDEAAKEAHEYLTKCYDNLKGNQEKTALTD